MKDKFTRVVELVQRIQEAADAYYNDQAIISDEEFDALKDELQDIDPDNPVLKQVGADSKMTHWEKMTHKIPMGSQEKVNTIEQLEKWLSDRSNPEICFQEKIDGLSVSLNYEAGILKSSILRANGVLGENIYRNVARMENVPQKLNKAFWGAIRGEIIVSKDKWAKFFPEMSNPRNAAAGVARRIEDGGQEHLTILAYDVVAYDAISGTFSTEYQKMQWLQEVGFTTPNAWVGSLKEIKDKYIKYEESERAQLPYEIDGFVIKINDLQIQKSWGYHGGDPTGNPKGQVALKFSHEMRESTITDVSWEVGITGRITPVAWFNPVKLAGAEISKASLHNIANVKSLGIKLGSTVLISRRNDVIPFVEKVLKVGEGDVEIPTSCPQCEQELVQEGEYLQCNNALCRKTGNIQKWVNVVEIVGLGPKVIHQLVNRGLVSNPGDLYLLTIFSVESLERMGKRSAEKLINAIQDKKEIPAYKILAGLNIQNCGRRVFKQLLSHYPTIDSITNLTIEEMASVPGIGPIKAKQLYDGLKNKADVLQGLFEAGIKVADSSQSSMKLSGLSFCFTGSMDTPRDKLISLVENNGGQHKSSVSKDLKYLVIADLNSTSSKAKKAKQLGIKLITEKEFLKML